MCVCVCLQVYMHVCVCVCVCTCLHVCMLVLAHVPVYLLCVCLHACLHVCVCVHSCTCCLHICLWVLACVSTWVCIRMSTRMHMFECLFSYTIASFPFRDTFSVWFLFCSSSGTCAGQQTFVPTPGSGSKATCFAPLWDCPSKNETGQVLNKCRKMREREGVIPQWKMRN